MTIESLIEGNTKALEANTAAVLENTAKVEILIAGREEALAKLTEAGSSATGTKPARKTAAQKKKEEEAAAAVEAETEKPKATDKPKAWEPDITDDGIKAIVGAHSKTLTDDDARGVFVGQMKEIAEYFSKDKFLDIKTAEERTQAVFYMIRFINGLTVDFKADYDYDQDPLTQGDLEPAADEADGADPMDMLG